MATTKARVQLCAMHKPICATPEAQPRTRRQCKLPQRSKPKSHSAHATCAERTYPNLTPRRPSSPPTPANTYAHKSKILPNPTVVTQPSPVPATTHPSVDHAPQPRGRNPAWTGVLCGLITYDISVFGHAVAGTGVQRRTSCNKCDFLHLIVICGPPTIRSAHTMLDIDITQAGPVL